MARVSSWISTGWSWVAHFSTAQWVAQLLGISVMGWLAYIGDQPTWLVIFVALGTFAFISIIWSRMYPRHTEPPISLQPTPPRAGSTHVAIGSGALGGGTAGRAEIERIKNFMDRKEHDEAQDRQKRLVEYLEVRRVPVPKAMTDNKIAMRLEPRPLYSKPEIGEEFARLRIPPSVAKERCDIEEHRILADASFYVLGDEEKDIWASREEKRAFHINDAQIGALIGLAKEFEQWWSKGK